MSLTPNNILNIHIFVHIATDKFTSYSSIMTLLYAAEGDHYRKSQLIKMQKASNLSFPTVCTDTCRQKMHTHLTIIIKEEGTTILRQSGTGNMGHGRK